MGDVTEQVMRQPSTTRDGGRGGAGEATRSGRLLSVDVFRAVTILTMIFVNDVAGARGVPAWMKHCPPAVSGMTFVDLVFPAFLFIVGMSIPLALERRRARGEAVWRTLGHVLLRVGELLVIGVFMVNRGGLNAQATGMSGSLWGLLFYVAVILVWNRYPRSRGPAGHGGPTLQGRGREDAGRPPRRAGYGPALQGHAGARRAAHWLRWGLWVVLRAVGVVGLVALAAVYRSGPADAIGWMHTSWWGILGLIGWAYLVGCVAYLVTRESATALMGVLGLLVLMYIGDKSGALGAVAPLAWAGQYVGLGGHIGGHGSVTVAGVVALLLVRGERGEAGGALGATAMSHGSGSASAGHAATAGAAARGIGRVLLFGAGLAAAGYLLQPLYGINKVAATPAWCLCSAAICCGVYALLYWVIDVHGVAGWARPLQPVGANPLLAYILPDIFWAALGVAGVTLPAALGVGGVAIVRSVVFAGLITGLTWVLTRVGVRLGL
jgi:heparan-alpha-glucosaminide N-acetyltransferase